MGKVARTHCSPIYTEWPSVPISIREHVWNIFYNAYDIGLKQKTYVMDSARIAWKDWKYRLRKVFDKYPTNAERKLHKPKHVKIEDWDMFIMICSSNDEKQKREKGKAVKGSMKLPHTSGQHGATRTAKILKKQSVDGKVTRTQLVMVLHTHPDGSYPFPESRPILDDINRRVSLDPSLIDQDLDNDVVALPTKKRDGKGLVKAMGRGISKTSFKASAPYKEALVQEKRKHEDLEIDVGVIKQRLDEETRPHKILEEKLTTIAQGSSRLGNNAQAQWNLPPTEREARSSTRCLLKNFRNKTMALGDIRVDIIASGDLCNVMIDEIFDYSADLYGCEGTFEDVIAGTTIKWPRFLLQMI